jgi:hypothetical protein
MRSDLIVVAALLRLFDRESNFSFGYVALSNGCVWLNILSHVPSLVILSAILLWYYITAMTFLRNIVSLLYLKKSDRLFVDSVIDLF